MAWAAPPRNYVVDKEIKSIFIFFFWGNIHMRTPPSLPVNASLSHLTLLSFSANKEQWSKDSSLLHASVLTHSQS